MVVVGLPNHLHEEAIATAARHGKAVLCTKPLARDCSRGEADPRHRRIGRGVRRLSRGPLLHAQVAQGGGCGQGRCDRRRHLGALRETHPGPHSAWFWDGRLTGGGAIIDLGCHCIEIIRNFVGKDNRPVEVMCWTDTFVHPIDDEDNAIALIRFESGAIGQFEVSWTFRGGMDLRDEVAGTDGTIWLNHFLRTGYEMFTAGGSGGYVAEKAETEKGWLFPVGDEVSELGYVDMFSDMFDAMDGGGEPQETFYDGYVVNAIMDACYRSAESRRWEPVELEWRGGQTERIRREPATYDGHIVIKEETLPDGRRKLILKDPTAATLSTGWSLGGDTPTRGASHCRWAEHVAAEWADRLATNPRLRMCLASGDTPAPVYESVVSGGASLAESDVLLLDEFIGLPAGHPVRCESMLRRQLIDLVAVGRFHRIDVDADDLDAEAARIDRADRAGSGIDLAVLGLGLNGHLGMNEPGIGAAVTRPGSSS